MSDAPDTDILVCRQVTEPLLLADNLTGPCVHCGTLLQFRPHAAHYATKLCMLCTFEVVSKDGGPVTGRITQETANDLKALSAKGRPN